MSTVCYLLGIILCLSTTTVSVKDFPVVSTGLLARFYTQLKYSIQDKVGAEAPPIRSGLEHVISLEFLGSKLQVPILLTTAKFDSAVLKKLPGIVGFGTLAGNFGGILKALLDMTKAGYPGQNILVIYALDYWTPGHERSDDDTKFYKESMSILAALKKAGAQVYRFTTDEDPQRESAETDLCISAASPTRDDFPTVDKLIMGLYNSTPGLMFVDGWMGTGSQELKSPEAKEKMKVSTTGLNTVITSLKNIDDYNQKQGSPKKVVKVCNDVNSGIQGKDGSEIADQYVPCTYLLAMIASKPFANNPKVPDLMKGVTVIVLFLQPKEGTSDTFYDIVLQNPGRFELNDEEEATLEIYRAEQQKGKRFAVHDPSTHEILA